MKRNSKSCKQSKSILARTVESFKVSKLKDYNLSDLLNNEILAKTFANNFDRNQSLKIFSYNHKNLADYEKANKNHKTNSNSFFI